MNETTEKNELNELNDIILNKGNRVNSNKKILLAIATLGVILIVVIMLMNSLSSNGTNNLPQAVLPPEPQTQAAQPDEEPLFKEVNVVQEKPSKETDLDAIAKKLKAESLQKPKKELLSKPTTDVKTKKVINQKPIVNKSVQKQIKPKQITPKQTAQKVIKGSYYIQVGSFSKYAPNKRFLNKIKSLGFSYSYHKIRDLNKVLVGPFNSKDDAKTARRKLRSKVEPGAFLIKL